MNKKVQKIERTVYEKKVTWVASDGMEFTNEQECKDYEKSGDCYIGTKLKQLPHQTNGSGKVCDTLNYLFGCEESLICVKVRDIADVATVNEWITFHRASPAYAAYVEPRKERLTTEDIGTIQVLGDDSCGDYYYYGALPELKAYISKRFDDLASEITEEVNE